jgi:hypothetical protein
VLQSLQGDRKPSPEAIEAMAEAALEIGESVIFTGKEMEVIKNLIFVLDDSLKTISVHEQNCTNPEFTDQQWKEFLGKLS